MEFIGELMQKTEDLTILQMILRGIIVFVLAIFMLQMAGKKTFGKRSPADNVIMIMLGAILSRGIVVPLLSCPLYLPLLPLFYFTGY
jgi:uncharacterized membrane protein YcaP (DUF421 family)